MSSQFDFTVHVRAGMRQAGVRQEAGAMEDTLSGALAEFGAGLSLTGVPDHVVTHARLLLLRKLQKRRQKAAVPRKQKGRKGKEPRRRKKLSPLVGRKRRKGRARRKRRKKTLQMKR